MSGEHILPEEVPDRQRRASWPGTIGAGSAVSPMRKRSTAAAAERPSAMAHTMRLWPRVMSPQTKTPVDVGRPRPVGGHVAPGVELEAQLGHHTLALGAEEPHGQQHQLAGQLELGALHRHELGPAAVAGDHLDLLAPQGPHLAGPVVRGTRRWSPQKTRSPPSSSADEVRRMSGHVGHGLSPVALGRGARA